MERRSELCLWSVEKGELNAAQAVCHADGCAVVLIGWNVSPPPPVLLIPTPPLLWLVPLLCFWFPLRVSPLRLSLDLNRHSLLCSPLFSSRQNIWWTRWSWEASWRSLFASVLSLHLEPLSRLPAPPRPSDTRVSQCKVNTAVDSNSHN